LKFENCILDINTGYDQCCFEVQSFEALLKLSIWHCFKNLNGKIYMFGEYGFDGQSSYRNHIPHTPHLRHKHTQPYTTQPKAIIRIVGELHK
jgi:hypothetical protein